MSFLFLHFKNKIYNKNKTDVHISAIFIRSRAITTPIVVIKRQNNAKKKNILMNIKNGNIDCVSKRNKCAARYDVRF